ncbi:MAG TPA: four helix bundle protein [Candidatus Paceibacterota bacterium]|nr:four helix bundle protein [Candidatus Paceibacterota bacterium]
MQTYRDLIVWQRAVSLVKKIYELTEVFPKSEKYILVSQMRRAAVSIPANIAEGYARKHRPEYIQFLRIAFGSGAELETHLTVAREIGMLKDMVLAQGTETTLNEVMRMLNRLIASLRDPSGYPPVANS